MGHEEIRVAETVWWAVVLLMPCGWGQKEQVGGGRESWLHGTAMGNISLKTWDISSYDIIHINCWLLKLKWYHNEILHMPRQHCCRSMCEISLWSNFKNSKLNEIYIYEISKYDITALCEMVLRSSLPSCQCRVPGNTQTSSLHIMVMMCATYKVMKVNSGCQPNYNGYGNSHILQGCFTCARSNIRIIVRSYWWWSHYERHDTTLSYTDVYTDGKQLILYILFIFMAVNMYSILYILLFTPGLSVDFFCWGSGAPTIWISKGPKQNLKGPSIEIHYRFSNSGGSIGPSGKIWQGPHWIFRGSGPLPTDRTPPPREPCTYMTSGTIYFFISMAINMYSLLDCCLHPRPRAPYTFVYIHAINMYSVLYCCLHPWQLLPYTFVYTHAINTYRKVSNITRTKSHNLNASSLIL